jgi:hypothetical protein
VKAQGVAVGWSHRTLISMTDDEHATDDLIHIDKSYAKYACMYVALVYTVQ